MVDITLGKRANATNVKMTLSPGPLNQTPTILKWIKLDSGLRLQNQWHK